jgi:hypothetical protein
LKLRAWWVIAMSGAILLVHVVMLVDGSLRNFIVVDEAAHVPAGIAHWRAARFDIYCVNPPLTRMLATLPALVLNPALNLRGLPFSPGDRPEWILAREFPEANSGRFLTIFHLARWAGIAWSLVGAVLIGRWARELYGVGAGFLGMVLWCFFPTAIAFAQVVTPDVPASVAGLAAAYAFWKYLRRPSTSMALWSGLLLGLAESTKFTHLLLYPLWALAWALQRRRKAAVWPTLGQAMVIIVASLAVINMSYGFRGTGRAIGSFRFFSKSFSGIGALESSAEGNRFRGQLAGAIRLPLPEDFVRGIDLQRRDFEAGFPSYLAGEWRRHGWWYYYLFASAIKVPLGMVVLIVWGIVQLARRWRGTTCVEAFLVLHASAIICFVSSQTGFNHHFRYVLPAFPFLILIACSTARGAGRSRPVRTALIAGFAAWCIAAGINSHPHSMSYFNEAVGGARGGDKYLVDSNIDWGQDLLFLKTWLDAHPEARPISLAYYNVINPRLIGIDFDLPPRAPTGLFQNDRRYQSENGPRAGYFAISVNHLRGAEFEIPDRDGRHWLTYRGDFEYFRLFRPIARAGDSIRIYHLTEAEVIRARFAGP